MSVVLISGVGLIDNSNNVERNLGAQWSEMVRITRKEEGKVG